MMRRSIRGFSVCAASVLISVGLVALAPAARAAGQTFHFVGLGDGHSWTDTDNWAEGSLPGFGDSVVIEKGITSGLHVDNAPTIELGTFTLGDLCSIAGGAITAANVSWSGGTIFSNVTAITGLEVTGDKTKVLQRVGSDATTGVLNVMDQGLVSGGELRLIFGTINNYGTFRSVGAPGSEALVNGNFGVNAKGSFINKPGGRITAAPMSTLHLINFALDDQGILGGGEPGLSGGTVRIGGSDVHIPTNAFVRDHIVFDAGSVITSDGNISTNSTATLTLGGSTSTILQGTANITGTGTIEWLTGTIKALTTISSGVTALIDSTNLHVLDNKLTGPLTVSPGAVVVQQNTGPVRLGLGAAVVNQGHWRVRNTDGYIGGATCCVAGSMATFTNQGSLDIATGRTLTLGTGPSVVGLDYRQLGTGGVHPADTAGGHLVIKGGDNELRGGIFSGVNVELNGNGVVHIANTVNIDTGTVLRQTEGTDVLGEGTFGGAGRYRWSDGTFTGRFVFGSALTVDVDDPDVPGSIKALNPGATAGGRLDFKGTTNINTTQTLRVTSTASKLSDIVTRGTTSWTKGTLAYAGVFSKLINQGLFKASPGTGNTATTTLSVSNSGDLRVTSGTLDVQGVALTQTAGTLGLYGHVLKSASVIKISGGTLRGPGTITGSVNNSAGAVAFLSRGLLKITGSYTQGSTASIRFVSSGTTTTTRDRLSTTGALSLSGKLYVSRTSGTSVSAYSLLTGASRTGVFGSKSLTGFPSGYHISYTTTAAKLVA